MSHNPEVQTYIEDGLTKVFETLVEYVRAAKEERLHFHAVSPVLMSLNRNASGKPDEHANAFKPTNAFWEQNGFHTITNIRFKSKVFGGKNAKDDVDAPKMELLLTAMNKDYQKTFNEFLSAIGRKYNMPIWYQANELTEYGKDTPVMVLVMGDEDKKTAVAVKVYCTPFIFQSKIDEDSQRSYFENDKYHPVGFSVWTYSNDKNVLHFPGNRVHDDYMLTAALNGWMAMIDQGRIA